MVCTSRHALGSTSKNKKNCQIPLYRVRIVSCNAKQWSILKFVSLNIACRCRLAYLSVPGPLEWAGTGPSSFLLWFFQLCGDCAY